MRTHNKSQLVRDHLLSKGSITSWEAIENYRATRLSAIIFNLKHRYNIKTIMMDGENCRYAKYVYKGVKEDV